MLELDALAVEPVDQRQHAVSGLEQRRRVGQLRADVAVDARHFEVGHIRRTAVQVEGVCVRHAELVLFESGGDVGVRLRIDIRVDAERDRRRRTVRLGHLVDAREFGCRLDVEALDVGLERLLDLGAGLAHTGEHHLARVSPGREHACQFSARDDVETRAQFRENAQNSQIAVGFDRVADLMRMPCQRLVVGLKRRH